MYAWESMKTYAGVSGRGVYVHDDGLAYLESATRWLDGRPLPVIWSAPWNPEGTESFDDRLAAPNGMPTVRTTRNYRKCR